MQIKNKLFIYCVLLLAASNFFFVQANSLPNYKSRNDPNCGLKSNIPALLDQNFFLKSNFSLKIVNGANAQLGDFPWMCRLEAKNTSTDSMFGCSGSIINSRFLLTSAQCLWNLRANKTAIMSHVVCNTVLQFTNTSADVRVLVSKTIMHPKYNFPYNDIGLVKLETDLDLSEGSPLGSICLPEPEEPINSLDDHFLLANGWGLEWFEEQPNGTIVVIGNTLQKVLLKVQAQEKCTKEFDPSLNNDHLCMETFGNRSTCLGDEGGSLAHYHQTKKRWFTYGIPIKGFCGEPVPSIFTRITTFSKWIWETVAANTEKNI